MNRFVLTTSLTALLFPMPGASQVPDDCETVRISDIGWTDNQAINGFATLVLGRPRLRARGVAPVDAGRTSIDES